VLGLADIVGELRRYVLDKIRTGDYENLDKILGRMEEIYSYLFSLDYPKGLTRDLRRKTDVARSIIEKTRGDISLSIQIDRLNKNLTRK
jgi:translin